MLLPSLVILGVLFNSSSLCAIGGMRRMGEGTEGRSHKTRGGGRGVGGLLLGCKVNI